MGERVIARKQQQRKPKDDYMPASWCNCGTCTIGSDQPECFKTNGVTDWEVGWTKCCNGFCASQRVCVPVDGTQCDIGVSSKGVDPLVSAEWDGTAPNLKCTYDLSGIDRYEQVEAFNAQFAPNDRVMAAFCERPSKNCQPGMESCSVLHSQNTGSDSCRTWFGSLAKDTDRDAVGATYCTRYNTEDCRCINRELTDEYNFLKAHNPISDKCWFKPCANASRYFTPSAFAKDTCPENICEIILNIYKDRDVSIYDNDFTCNMGPGTPGSRLLSKYWPYATLLALLLSLVYVNIG